MRKNAITKRLLMKTKPVLEPEKLMDIRSFPEYMPASAKEDKRPIRLEYRILLGTPYSNCSPLRRENTNRLQAANAELGLKKPLG